MGLTYYHLNDDDVRTEMVKAWREEWNELSEKGQLAECYGKQLTDAGWAAWEQSMPEALEKHNDDWLVEQIRQDAYWFPKLLRRGKPVEYNKREAAEKLCTSEFNVAYIRGLARVLKARGETHAVVYRAGNALEERSECSSWEGSQVPLDDILAGHRVRYFPPPGDRRAWSLPSGPNCHHSIHAVGAVPQPA